MPFLASQSGCSSCSGAVPASVMANVKRLGTTKGFRQARGLGGHGGSMWGAWDSYTPEMRGLGDLSTLPQDLANGDWMLVAVDVLPWVAVAWAATSLIGGIKAKFAPAPARRGRRKR